jgi:hypothetical protein
MLNWAKYPTLDGFQKQTPTDGRALQLPHAQVAARHVDQPDGAGECIFMRRRVLAEHHLHVLQAGRPKKEG